MGGKLHAPVTRSHVLVVQTLLSSQGAGGVPAWHIMFATSQVSTPLQASPSSVQAFPAGVKQLRAAGSQVLLHSSPLAQGSPAPLGTHTLPVQVSLLQKLQSVSTLHEA